MSAKYRVLEKHLRDECNGTSKGKEASEICPGECWGGGEIAEAGGHVANNFYSVILQIKAP
jgi:hypothetical protein